MMTRNVDFERKNNNNPTLQIVGITQLWIYEHERDALSIVIVIIHEVFYPLWSTAT